MPHHRTYRVKIKMHYKHYLNSDIVVTNRSKHKNSLHNHQRHASIDHCKITASMHQCFQDPFSNLCIYIIGEFCNLSVFACCTSYTIHEILSPLDVFYHLVERTASFLDLLCTFLQIASIKLLSFDIIQI